MRARLGALVLLVASAASAADVVRREVSGLPVYIKTTSSGRLFLRAH